MTYFPFHFHSISRVSAVGTNAWRWDGPAKHAPRKDTRTPASAGARVLELGLRCGYSWTGFGRFRRPCGCRLGIGLLDVDAALEEGAILDADACRGYVAGQGALGANVNPVGGGDIAAYLAQNDDFAGGDGGCDLAVASTVTRLPGRLMLPSILPR